MHSALREDKLKARDHLVVHHKHGLEAEMTAALIEELHQ